MSRKHLGEHGSGYGMSPHLKGVGLSILVIGLSLAAIVIIWATIGVHGPTFSADVMQEQQSELRERYGLPPEPRWSPEQLEIPPSLRDIAGSGTSIADEGGNNNSSQTSGNTRSN
ncbi:MAG TPA: hypothetical protein VNI77_08170 [Nitrososphaera sp.]|nr:hypothetical protein [Nitrososphaera sp.]